MKFLLAVLAIHFVAEMIGNRKKDNDTNDAGNTSSIVRHPAEFELR